MISQADNWTHIYFIFDSELFSFYTLVQRSLYPYYIRSTPQGAHLMGCNRSWHLKGNPKLVGNLLALEKKRDV